jgi:hypothetical protein
MSSPFTLLSAVPFRPPALVRSDDLLSEAAQMPIVLDFFRKPLLCAICNKPLDPRIAVTDQDGKPVHEECYVLMVRQQDAKKPPKNS